MGRESGGDSTTRSSDGARAAPFLFSVLRVEWQRNEAQRLQWRRAGRRISFATLGEGCLMTAKAIFKATLVALLCLLYSASQAIAQETLRGVRTVTVIVETPDDDARRCGITKELLESSALFILQQSRLRIVPVSQENDGYLYVNATVQYQAAQNFCSGALAVKFRTSGMVSTRHNPAPTFDVFTVFESLTIMGSPPIGLPALMQQSTESFTKRFLAEWVKQNPGK